MEEKLETCEDLSLKIHYSWMVAIFLLNFFGDQPLQVGAYTLSAKSVTEDVNFILKHFLNEFFLLSQFFLRVQVHTLMIFLTKIFSTKTGGDLWFLK